MATIEHYKGEHQTDIHAGDAHSHHKDMIRTHEQNKEEIRKEVFDRMCARPGNAYCEYNTMNKTFDNHGLMRVANGNENFEVLLEDSNNFEDSNNEHQWVGTSRMKYDIEVERSPI